MMKNKLIVLFLMLCLICTSVSFAFGLTEPEQPIIDETNPEASNELIEEYNQQVDEYNAEVETHNQQVDADYEAAQVIYEEEKAEVETNNTFVENVETKIEEDSSEERGFENNSTDEIPTDWEDETNEEDLKTIQIEKSDNPSGEKIKVINIHVYLDENQPYSPDCFYDSIDDNTFELSEDLKNRAVLTEWETAEIDYDDTVTLSSEAEDFAGNIVWLNGKRKWFGVDPKPYFFRAIEGYTQGYWSAGGSMMASNATVDEYGWSPGGETYTVQYAEETTTSNYLYNGQLMTEEVVTRTTDKQKPKNIFALFTYLFTRLAPEPEKKELPESPVKGEYLNKLDHLDLLDIPIPEPTPEPTPEPVIPEPTPEPIIPEPTPEPIKPIPKPIVEPVVEPVVEPTTEPVVEPMVEPTKELTKKPVVEKPIKKSTTATPVSILETTSTTTDIIIADNTPSTTTATTTTIIPDATPKAQSQGSWALINLIATILSCICAAILLFIRKNKKDNEPTDEEKKDMRGMIGTKAASILTGIISIIIFIFTEDMTLPMVYTDKWTILMILLLIVEMINIFIIRQQSKGEEEDG